MCHLNSNSNWTCKQFLSQYFILKIFRLKYSKCKVALNSFKQFQHVFFWQAVYRSIKKGSPSLLFSHLKLKGSNRISAAIVNCKAKKIRNTCPQLTRYFCCSFNGYRAANLIYEPEKIKMVLPCCKRLHKIFAKLDLFVCLSAVCFRQLTYSTDWSPTQRTDFPCQELQMPAVYSETRPKEI